jgi:hypothetical protein
MLVGLEPRRADDPNTALVTLDAQLANGRASDISERTDASGVAVAAAAPRHRGGRTLAAIGRSVGQRRLAVRSLYVVHGYPIRQIGSVGPPAHGSL